MNLKIPQIIAIELASAPHHNSDSLELLGIEPLKQVNNSLKIAVNAGDITSNNLFSNIFNSNDTFFYGLEEIKNGVTIKYERGLGSLVFENNRTFLKRNIPISVGTCPSDLKPCSNGSCASFHCSDCESIVVFSSYPANYNECLFAANTLITSSSPFLPSPFVVENNSLVGRLDKDLTSLSFNDSSFIEKLVKSISSYTKQILLKTSKLDIKKLATPHLLLNPSTKNNHLPKKGTIIYDESDDLIKYYDGTVWRSLEGKVETSS
ncbi:hypothetical protein EB001_12870 [bacterium]|jgi:hypothetical protein|nr:hypothetical protein [bacterium]